MGIDRASLSVIQRRTPAADPYWFHVQTQTRMYSTGESLWPRDSNSSLVLWYCEILQDLVAGMREDDALTCTFYGEATVVTASTMIFIPSQGWVCSHDIVMFQTELGVVTFLSRYSSGCIFGLITFSRLLSYLFKNFNDIVTSTLVGFLLGSLIKIWPFSEVVEYDLNNDPIYTTPVFPTTELLSEIVYFTIFSLIGIFIMWVLEKKFIGISKSN